jgi:signal peptidase I
MWTTIALHLPFSVGKYDWSTSNVPNSSSFDYQLKAEVTSLSDTGSAIVENISVINPAIYSSGEPYIISKKSKGTGRFDIVVVDSFAVTGHSYLLAFYKVGGGDGVACDIVDVKTGTTKLSGANLFDGFHETKYFDGIRLRIQSDPPALDSAGTGWSAGTSTLKMIPGPDHSAPSIDNQLPFDYEIAFADMPVDTSFSDGSEIYPLIPVNFTITNVTTLTHTQFLIEDNDLSKTVTQGDVIRIIETNVIHNGDLFLTWEIKYGDGSLNVVYPKAGDVYVLKTKKPFAAGDSIVFTTQGLTSVKQNNEVLPISFELAQNYPNPFNPATTIRFIIPASNDVTLKICNVLGKEVATVVSRRLQAGEYSVRWNAETMPSGVYFYTLRSGSLTATKKLILLK